MAVSLVAVGALIIFVAIAVISLPAALLMVSGGTLVALGAFFIEVPQP